MTEPNNTNEIISKVEPLLEGASLYELSLLNKMIVERIRMMQKAGALMFMSKFNVGDQVSWHGNDGTVRRGVIFRLNHKTASVKTSDEGHWNVSPLLLTKEG